MIIFEGIVGSEIFLDFFRLSFVFSLLFFLLVLFFFFVLLGFFVLLFLLLFGFMSFFLLFFLFFGGGLFFLLFLMVFGVCCFVGGVKLKKVVIKLDVEMKLLFWIRILILGWF